MDRPRVPEKDDSTSLICNDIDMGLAGVALHNMISSSSTESSVPRELDIKRQRRKHQNRKE